MVIVNFDALNTSPYVILNSDNLQGFETAPPLTVTYDYDDGVGTESLQRTVATYDTGLDWNSFKAASSIGRNVEKRQDYESLRVVAGGMRLYKTSANENESGVIRAHYAHRGAYVSKSIRALLDEPGNNKTHAKAYVAGGTGCCAGRAGFILGNTYRPRDSDEVQDFHPADNMFLERESDKVRIDDINDHSLYDSFYGPVQLYDASAALDDW